MRRRRTGLDEIWGKDFDAETRSATRTTRCCLWGKVDATFHGCGGSFLLRSHAKRVILGGIGDVPHHGLWGGVA